jgi:hypothetical protein
MKGMLSGSRFDRIAKFGVILLSCGGIPFFFMPGVWGEVLLKVYLLTAFLFFILLSSYWESTSELWYWKAMVPISLVHAGIVTALVRLNFEFPQIDRLPRMTYSVLTLLLGV